MLEDYQMFIIGLAAREKPPTFEELIGIATRGREVHKFEASEFRLSIMDKEEIP